MVKKKSICVVKTTFFESEKNEVENEIRTLKCLLSCAQTYLSILEKKLKE